jgi:hypothetical protein
MNIRAAVFGVALGLMLLSTALAAPPADVQAEVGYLLQHIEESGCEFYRNGRWYDGKRARAHLSDKYRYLVAQDQVSTTEEFIERAATKSSISGIPYQIRCVGAVRIDCNLWLLGALVAYRQVVKK